MRRLKNGGYLLLGTLLVAFILRIWGSNFGLPKFYFHTDEILTLDKVFGFYEINPHIGESLNAMHYFLKVVVKLVGIDPNYHYYRGILVGRWISALISTASVLCLFLIVKSLYNRTLAILSSMFLAVSFANVRMAHYLRQDVYTHFLGLVSYIFSTKYLLDGKRRNLLIAGFLIGVAGAIRLNGLIFVIPPFLASIYRYRSIPEWFELNFLLGLSVLMGFLSSIWPYFIAAHPSEWLLFIKTPLDIQGASTFASSQGGIPSYVFFIRYLAESGLYYPIFLLTLMGIFLFLKSDLRCKLYFLSFPLIYFLVISLRSVRFDRLTTALTPFLCLFAAFTIYKVGQRSKWAAVPLAMLVLLISFFRIARFDSIISQKDTREIAYEWILGNIDKSAPLYMIGSMDQAGSLLEKQGFEKVTIVHGLDKAPFGEYSSGLVVINSQDYRIFENYRNTTEYANSFKQLDRLRKRGAVVKKFYHPLFEGEYFAEHELEHSVTVNAYHNPTVYIYEMPPEK